MIQSGNQAANEGKWHENAKIGLNSVKIIEKLVNVVL